MNKPITLLTLLLTSLLTSALTLTSVYAVDGECSCVKQQREKTPMELENSKAAAELGMQAQAQAQYRSLAGEYNWKYFDNSKLRQPLVNLIGSNKYSILRKNMETSIPSELIANRFLVIQGCKPHDCGDKFGVVVIDTVTNDIWWMLVHNYKYVAGATKKVSVAELSAYKNIFKQIKFADGRFLSFDMRGKLIATSSMHYL